MNTAINKELLFCHFDGCTTPLQVELLREWLQNSDHQQLYYHWLQEWERQHPQMVANPDLAFALFQQKIASPPNPLPTNPLPARNRWLPRTYLMAASITTLLLMLSYLTRIYWNTRTIATDYGEVRSILLDDGSRVTLNAGSQLRIPRFRIGSPTRDVLLRGEAEFVIVHTAADDPFLVHTTNGVDIVVLGTEFVVNTRRNNTRVSLNRGKVQLRYPTPDQINTLTMQPGDWVNLATNEPPQRGHQPVEQTTGATWKNYQYTFRQTPMPEIALLLTDNFGLTVLMDDELAQRSVTGTFHAQNADELLLALAELFDFRMTHQGNTIKLYLPDSTSIKTNR